MVIGEYSLVRGAAKALDGQDDPSPLIQYLLGLMRPAKRLGRYAAMWIASRQRCTPDESVQMFKVEPLG
jgi:hypothetical protein